MSPSSTPFSQLLKRIAADPSEAQTWESMVTASSGRFLAIARAVTGDDMLAEDAVQETFLHIRAGAWRFSPEPSNPDGSAWHWMQRVCLNASRSLLRREEAERRRRGFGPKPNPPCVVPAPSEELSAALKTLPDTLRQAVVCRYLMELEGPALATALGCSRIAARTRVHRGIEALRERMGTAFSIAVLLAFCQRGEAVEGDLVQHWGNLCNDPPHPILPADKILPQKAVSSTHWLLRPSGFIPVATVTVMSVVGSAVIFMRSPQGSESKMRMPKEADVLQGTTQPIQQAPLIPTTQTPPIPVLPKEPPKEPPVLSPDPSPEKATTPTIEPQAVVSNHRLAVHGLWLIAAWKRSEIPQKDIAADLSAIYKTQDKTGRFSADAELHARTTAAMSMHIQRSVDARNAVSKAIAPLMENLGSGRPPPNQLAWTCIAVAFAAGSGLPVESHGRNLTTRLLQYHKDDPYGIFGDPDLGKPLHWIASITAISSYDSSGKLHQTSQDLAKILANSVCLPKRTLEERFLAQEANRILRLKDPSIPKMSQENLRTPDPRSIADHPLFLAAIGTGELPIHE